MIAVVGEALVDLIVGADGQVDARLGGGPYNAARTLSRLGVPAAFLGGLADDAFGRLLRARLAADGVALGLPGPSPRPSALAVVAVDPAGVAGYTFYLDGTAAADVTYQALRSGYQALAVGPVRPGPVRPGPVLPGPVLPDPVLPDPVRPAGRTALHVGSLGLVADPVGAAVQRLVAADVPDGALVLLDPNCRPGAVPDPAAYRARLGAIAHRADIVKASVEDLAYLFPATPPEAAAKALLAAGPRLVLVTDGPHPARAFLPDAVLAADVPPVTVADTIGAGDAFGGGFLAWWTAHDLGQAELSDPDLVTRALTAAAAVAALTCTRPGADPPALTDLRARNWWPNP